MADVHTAAHQFAVGTAFNIALIDNTPNPAATAGTVAAGLVRLPHGQHHNAPSADTEYPLGGAVIRWQTLQRQPYRANANTNNTDTDQNRRL